MTEQVTDETLHENISRRRLFTNLLGRTGTEAAQDLPDADGALAEDEEQASVPESPALQTIGPVEAVGDWARVQVNRRSVLVGMVLASIGINRNEAFRRYLNGHWEKVPPSLTFLGGEVPRNPRQVALFLPGYGDIHSEAEAKQLDKGGQIPPDLPTAYFSESLGDTTIKEKADLVRDAVDVDSLESIILIGRSMGGQEAWALAAELGVPVSKLIMFSSPFDLTDGFYANFASYLSHAPNDRELGFIAKLFYSWCQAKSKNGYWDILDNAEFAWENAVHGDDPLIMEKRAKVSLGIHLANRSMIKKLSRVMIPGYTKVYYTESKNPGTDHTVHDTASEKQYCQECHVLGGIQYNRMKADYNGHANVKDTANMLVSILNEPAKAPPKKVLAEGPSK